MRPSARKFPTSTLALLLLPGLLSLASCRSHDTGRLPETVVDLYDVMLPAGKIEIEADREGHVIEIEADIRIEDLPARVLAAAERRLPTGVVTGAEIEYVGGEVAYEVKMSSAGTDYEFVYTPAGRLIESEQTITRYETPDAVVATAREAVPGGLLASFEEIHGRGGLVYHVKVVREGAWYKLVIAPDGRLNRIVREAKAEIEIPLR